MTTTNKINYVEFPTLDIDGTKSFFISVFSWSFEDYGPDYAAFSSAGIDGGFFRSEKVSSCDAGAALVVIYSDALEQVQAKVEGNGGTIVKPIFPFPGGRRFHFTEPGGNELAVWSDVD